MEVDFWAKLWLIDGTPMPGTIGELLREQARIYGRHFEASEFDDMPLATKWRKGLSVPSNPGVQYLIFIAEQREGEFGFYALDRDRWEEKYRAELPVGAEFFLKEGLIDVARGQVTEVTQPQATP